MKSQLKKLSENRKTNHRFNFLNNVFEEAIKEFEIPTEKENLIYFNEDMNFEEWIKENF